MEGQIEDDYTINEDAFVIFVTENDFIGGN